MRAWLTRFAEDSSLGCNFQTPSRLRFQPRFLFSSRHGLPQRGDAEDAERRGVLFGQSPASLLRRNSLVGIQRKDAKTQRRNQENSLSPESFRGRGPGRGGAFVLDRPSPQSSPHSCVVGRGRKRALKNLCAFAPLRLCVKSLVHHSGLGLNPDVSTILRVLCVSAFIPVAVLHK